MQRLDQGAPSALRLARQAFPRRLWTGPVAISLDEAKHILSVHLGFFPSRNFDQMTANQHRLALIMDAHPWLTDIGNGIISLPEWSRKRFDERWNRARASLMQDAPKLPENITWIRQYFETRQTINEAACVFWLKEFAERDLGYMTSGLFTAAAMCAGVPW